MVEIIIGKNIITDSVRFWRRINHISPSYSVWWHLHEPEEKCLFLDQFDEREPNLVFLFGGGESIGRRKISTKVGAAMGPHFHINQ